MALMLTALVAQQVNAEPAAERPGGGTRDRFALADPEGADVAAEHRCQAEPLRDKGPEGEQRGRTRRRRPTPAANHRARAGPSQDSGSAGRRSGSAHIDPGAESTKGTEPTEPTEPTEGTGLIRRRDPDPRPSRIPASWDPEPEPDRPTTPDVKDPAPSPDPVVQ